jgi:aminopeptidase N
MVGEAADEHPDLAFDFAVAHRERMDALLDDSARSRYYPRLAAKSADPAMVGKVRRFAEANVPAPSRRAAETAMAQVEFHAAVAKHRLAPVDAWLQSRGM